MTFIKMRVWQVKVRYVTTPEYIAAEDINSALRMAQGKFGPNVSSVVEEGAQVWVETE